MSRVHQPWLWVVLWMALIFIVSTDLGSGSNTSRIIEPVLRWLNPDMSAEAVDRVHFFIRKGGHLSEYAVLSLLALRAARSSLTVARSVWSWPAAGIALLVAATYASTDEFHQSFISSRTASPVDVMIDTTGALIALTLVFVWRKARPVRANV